MASGRYNPLGVQRFAVLALACGAALTGGCGAHGTQRSDGDAVARPAATECARVQPGLPLRPAPRLASGEVAPRGASMIRVCRFSGLNAHPPRVLVRAADIRAAPSVDRVIEQLNRLPPMPAVLASCPDDDLSQVVLLLAYPHGDVLRIAVGLSGCETVTNGVVHRIAARGGGPRLIAELKRRTAHP